MAKINIIFDNADYPIDEASIASATAELKSHLSTVMNGSGEVINLDGVSYSVDSAKLSNATNDFVAHLRTIAGNDSKVVVGGVEYGVDTNKTSGAITALRLALNNLLVGNDDGGSADTVVLAEKAIDCNTFTEFGVYSSDFVVPAEYALNEGQSYKVMWDGVEYICTAFAWDYDGVQMITVGNGAALGIASNNEPFLLNYNPNYNGTQVFAAIQGSHTVAIYKNGGSAETVVLSETTFDGFVYEPSYLMSAIDSIYPARFTLNNGRRYKVVWDDVEYTCTAYAYELDGMSNSDFVAIGHTPLVESSGNNEPFFIFYSAYLNNNNIYANAEGSHTVSIYEIG